MSLYTEDSDHLVLYKKNPSGKWVSYLGLYVNIYALQLCILCMDPWSISNDSFLVSASFTLLFQSAILFETASCSCLCCSGYPIWDSELLRNWIKKLRRKIWQHGKWMDWVWFGYLKEIKSFWCAMNMETRDSVYEARIWYETWEG